MSKLTHPMSSATDAQGSIRLLIVDDQPLVRRGLAELLDLEDNLEIVGEAENGREALRLAQELHPDVVLMDIKMPVMSGIEATIQLRQSGPAVVLLTTSEELDDMVAGVNAGAAGYLFKNATVDEIIDAVARASRGEHVIHSRVTLALARRIGEDRAAAPPQIPLHSPPELTTRELETLRYIRAGHQNKRIAQLLNISEGTVKVHVSNLLSKLEAKNRTEAANRALQLGLLKDK